MIRRFYKAEQLGLHFTTARPSGTWREPSGFLAWATEKTAGSELRYAVIDAGNHVAWAIVDRAGRVLSRSGGGFYGETAVADARAAAVRHQARMYDLVHEGLPPTPVRRPGIRGGHFRITPKGEVRYDQPALPLAAAPAPAPPAPPARPGEVQDDLGIATVRWRFREEHAPYEYGQTAEQATVRPEDVDLDVERDAARRAFEEARRFWSSNTPAARRLRVLSDDEADPDRYRAATERKQDAGVILTFRSQDYGMGSSGAGRVGCKVFWGPYSVADRRERLGVLHPGATEKSYTTADELGVDPIYVLAHELHHCHGSYSEFDVASDVVAAAAHLSADCRFNPTILRDRLWSWVTVGLSQPPRSRRYIEARAALRYLHDLYPEQLARAVVANGVIPDRATWDAKVVPKVRGFRKASQLALFPHREVQRPGSRGGRGYFDAKGHWQYGDRPTGYGTYVIDPVKNAKRKRPIPPDPWPRGQVPDLTVYDWIVLNSSGGKDSQATVDYVLEQADRQGVPRDRLVVVHCDLGRMDWENTAALAYRQAAHYGLRFEVVKRDKGDLLHELLTQRRKWPSEQQRWCTKDQKTSQVEKLWTRLKVKSQALGIKRPRILDCLGLRAQESPKRAGRPAFEALDHNSQRAVDSWLPLKWWTNEEVWARINASHVEHGKSYDYGFPRLSCVFCPLAPKEQTIRAGMLHADLLDEYVAAEKTIGHRFHRDFSMADVQHEVNLRLRERMLRFMKARTVQRPGSRGGTGYYDAKGKWQYGTRKAFERAALPADEHPSWGSGYVYHVTTHAALAAIRRHGLDPAVAGKGERFGGGYLAHERGRVFYADDPYAALRWHGHLEGIFEAASDKPGEQTPVMLRVRREHAGALERDEPGTRDVGDSSFGTTRVPPEHVEVFTGDGWRRLTSGEQTGAYDADQAQADEERAEAEEAARGYYTVEHDPAGRVIAHHGPFPTENAAAGKMGNLRIAMMDRGEKLMVNGQSRVYVTKHPPPIQKSRALLFLRSKAVKAPGAKGGKFYITATGKVRYGVKPAPEAPATDYRGQHGAPDHESGAPLHNVAGVYPDDVYGPNGLRYYGTGEDAMDAEAWSLIQSYRNKPNRVVRVFRAVPKDVKGGINPGDWVTPIRRYATAHGRGALNGDFKIQSKLVHARDCFTAGDSWLEWGYDPQPEVPRTYGLPVKLNEGAQLARALKRGIYRVHELERRPNYLWHDEKPDIVVSIVARRPTSWVEGPRDQFGEDRGSHYDPTLAHVVDGVVRLRPDSGLKPDLRDVPKQDGVLWRGMSAEEYAEVQRTGVVKSRGDYNFTSQEGLTYFDVEAAGAEMYAHAMAPWQHQATPLRAAYVVGVRDPGTARHVEGTGDTERGIPGEVPASSIVAVYEGVPYATEHGTATLSPRPEKATDLYEVAQSGSPRTFVGWRQVPALLKGAVAQLALFEPREPVKAPGSKGGRFYITPRGNVKYGERPTPRTVTHPDSTLTVHLRTAADGDFTFRDQVVASAEDVAAGFRAMTDLDRERAWIVSLDEHDRILAVECFSVGSINQTMIHPRELLKSPLILGAKKAWFIHNHPSGDPTPSDADLAIDQRLNMVMEAAGLPIMALVVARDGWSWVGPKARTNPWGAPVEHGVEVPEVESIRMRQFATGEAVRGSEQAAKLLRGMFDPSARTVTALALDGRNKVLGAFSLGCELPGIPTLDQLSNLTRTLVGLSAAAVVFGAGEDGAHWQATLPHWQEILGNACNNVGIACLDLVRVGTRSWESLMFPGESGLLKAQLFEHRPVRRPGIRGGKWWVTRGGEVRYDIPPPVAQLGHGMPHERVTVFRSGASDITTMRAYVAADEPIGVEVHQLSKPATQVLVDYARFDGGDVFIDSGAFPAHKRGLTVDFADVLARYGRIVRAFYEGVDPVKVFPEARHLHFVAPDVIGDQAATLVKLREHAPALRVLLNKGVSLLVGHQAGALPLPEFHARVRAILGTDRFVVAVPSNRAPIPMDQVLDLVRQVQPARLHFLGLGRADRLAERLHAVHAVAPATVVTADANQLYALASDRNRPLPRAVNAIVDQVVGDLHAGGGRFDEAQLRRTVGPKVRAHVLAEMARDPKARLASRWMMRRVSPVRED